MPSSPSTTGIIILGAGVTGLQTALSLLTSPSTSHHRITIIAQHTPGDISIDYTSPWAGGVWRSHASTSPEDRENREWDERTYHFWSELLGPNPSPEVEKEIGLAYRESRNFTSKPSHETVSDGSGLWWRDTVRNFRVLDKADWPEGAIFGVSYEAIYINVPQYLQYLQKQVEKLGARVIKSAVDVSAGLEGVVVDAKRLHAQSSSGEEVIALINCTGLSARHFVGAEEATRMFPVRGQTVLVKGEAKMGRTYTFPVPANEVAYVIMRPGSGTTIFGGCREENSGDGTEDKKMTERILKRIRDWKMAEDLRTGPDGDFEVLSAQVGLRPGRQGSPRVEVESKAKIEGLWVVHSYGHAGAGFQNSVGSAEKVVKLVESLI